MASKWIYIVAHAVEELDVSFLGDHETFAAADLFAEPTVKYVCPAFTNRRHAERYAARLRRVYDCVTTIVHVKRAYTAVCKTDTLVRKSYGYNGGEI